MHGGHVRIFFITDQPLNPIPDRIERLTLQGKLSHKNAPQDFGGENFHHGRPQVTLPKAPL